jgi:Uncharacterised protein family UPF0547
MGAAGQVFNQNLVLADKPDSLMQRLVSATAGTTGYALNTAGPNSLVLTRKYTPTWAIVLGVIAGLLTIIGFALLLVKSTESLTITLSEVPEGTRVTSSGVATPEIIARLNGVFSSVAVGPAREHVEVAGDLNLAESSPETKTCPRCAETVKAQAVVCRFCGYEFDRSR